MESTCLCIGAGGGGASAGPREGLSSPHLFGELPTLSRAPTSEPTCFQEAASHPHILWQMGKLRLAQLAWGTAGAIRLQTGVGTASLASCPRGSVEGGFCHYPFNRRGNGSSNGPQSLAVRKGQQGAHTQVCLTPRCDLSHQVSPLYPTEPRHSAETPTVANTQNHWFGQKVARHTEDETTR